MKANSFDQHRIAAEKAAAIVLNTKLALESATGIPIVSSSNYKTQLIADDNTKKS